MRSVEAYMSWLLPAFQSNTEWSALVNAISEELVDLHKRQMGSTDNRGFSGVNLIPNGDFSDNDNWRTYADPYDPHSTNMLGGDWRIETDTNRAYIPSGSTRSHSWLVRFLPNIFINQAYRVKYRINAASGAFINLYLGPVEDTYLQQLPSSVGNHEVVVRITDYFLEFLAIYSDDATIEITNIELVEEYASDVEERFSVLRRLMDIDEAPSWILERAQKSLNLPWIEGLPDELVRRFLRYSSEFNTLSGTLAGSALLFYLFGFRVRFQYLYAHKDDYEANTYPWVPQESYLHLVSSEEPGGTIYAQVATQSIGSHDVILEDGHAVLVGDMITNTVNEYENYYRRVIAVSGNTISLDYTADNYVGDLISIIRQPDYPLNPDPDNYFPIPWIDVFVKSDLLSGFSLTFDELRAFLEERLPANVNIRFISYDNEIPFHSFQFSQTLFQVRYDDINTVTLIEAIRPPSDSTTPAGDSDTIVVASETPHDGEDVFGNPCDAYSYVVMSTEDPLQYIATEVRPNA